MNNSNCIPIDKVAARVISKGINYKYESNHNRNNYDNPLNCVENTNKVYLSNSLEFIDLRGKKFGSFTVIGLLKREGEAFIKSQKGRWLVRCSCGQYENRTSRAIKNHLNNPRIEGDEDLCKQCEDTRRVKRLASAKSMGYTYTEWMEKFGPRRGGHDYK